MRVNYLGSVWCLRAFLPALEAAAPSDVVNVVSVAGTVAVPQSGPYAASKHAQLAFSRATAAQLGTAGFRVHTILPGFAETPGFPQYSVIPRALHWTIIGPERIARSIMAAIRHDRRESFVPWFYRPVAWTQALLPGTMARVSVRAGSTGVPRSDGLRSARCRRAAPGRARRRR